MIQTAVLTARVIFNYAQFAMNLIKSKFNILMKTFVLFLRPKNIFQPSQKIKINEIEGRGRVQDCTRSLINSFEY